jgi:PKD repeat protein
LTSSGRTASSNFPTTSGTYKTSYGGGPTDGFIAKLTASGNSLLASTFVGTSKYDQTFMIQSDYNGDVYVYGQTEGSYPVSSGVYSNSKGSQFIHKFSPDLSMSVFSTVFGTGSSTPDISPTAFLVDTCMNIYCTGWGTCNLGNTYGTTTGLSITSNAQQKTTDGCDFYFIVLSTNASSLLYASFFGDPNADDHVDGGTSRFDNAGVIYQSVCASCGGYSGFPTTTNAWSQTNNSLNCNNAVIKLDFQFAGITAAATFSPNDTVCVGTAITFTNASVNAASFEWDFSDNPSIITTIDPPVHVYNTPGTYSVKLIANNTNSCTYTDTIDIQITVLPLPELDLGNDTILCANENLILDPYATNAISYSWSTGETTSKIIVNSANLYSVEVSNGVCTASDTINVQVIQKPQLGSDTTVCEGTYLTLNAENVGADYLWSTMQNTQTIAVVKSGTYWVDVLGGICKETDTIHVTMEPKPIVNLGPDTVICGGTTITLDAPVNTSYSYLWSTAETSSSIIINGPGNYDVSVFYLNCYSYDEIEVALKF